MPAGRKPFRRKPGEARWRSTLRTTIRTRRGAFATPRFRISTTSTRVARYLLRDAGDAEDAVQECYLRALKHFDSYRGPAMKPWLLAILRNVCRAEFARRASLPTDPVEDVAGKEEQTPLWSEAPETPETQILRQRDASAIQRLVGALAEPFRETFVLREIENLSYREIADVAEVPVGTVMSRLARARAMLRSAWMAEQEPPK